MSNKLHFLIGSAILILSLSIVLIIITAFKFLPPRLPLFYSLSWGEIQLATHQQFLILPASIGIVAILNLLLAWQLHPSQSFFKKLLLLSSVTAGLILTIAFTKIVLIFV